MTTGTSCILFTFSVPKETIKPLISVPQVSLKNVSHMAVKGTVVCS
jgi:hypothetical protein